MRVAAASRTNKGNWARHLLGEFCVPGCDDRRLNELIPLQEIFPGSKLTHFERLRESTGIQKPTTIYPPLEETPRLVELYEEALPLYEDLLAHALPVKGAT